MTKIIMRLVVATSDRGAQSLARGVSVYAREDYVRALHILLPLAAHGDRVA
jgi:hypothetical protein